MKKYFLSMIIAFLIWSIIMITEVVLVFYDAVEDTQLAIMLLALITFISLHFAFYKAIE